MAFAVAALDSVVASVIASLAMAAGALGVAFVVAGITVAVFAVALAVAAATTVSGLQWELLEVVPVASFAIAVVAFVVFAHRTHHWSAEEPLLLAKIERHDRPIHMSACGLVEWWRRIQELVSSSSNGASLILARFADAGFFLSPCAPFYRCAFGSDFLDQCALD